MRPGGVRNSNAYTLPAFARLAGAKVMSVERCADDFEATRLTVARAMKADVAVFCGGVSVGDHDYVKDAFALEGVDERFWGVALRPGKPTWFGTRDGTLAFGLPGNPVSAFVTFVLFVRPALRALQGASPDLDVVRATLTADVPRMESRDQAVRCSLEMTSDGWLATPTGPQGSHVLTSMLGADAMAVIEAGRQPATVGSQVDVQLLAVVSGA
jgi:molybdopterin molybdotransferase